MRPFVSMIAAIGRHRELGKNNRLLWSIPEDTRHFRALTKGHVVIMGRKTFESIGHPLPNRMNIVVSRNPAKKEPGVHFFVSFEDALSVAKSKEVERKDGIEPEIFIIGGGQIYAHALSIADRLYLTIVDRICSDADTFFPEYEDQFTHVMSKETKHDQNWVYTFLTLQRSSTLRE